MHAIDAGNVILEIQQNSDTTYRVYDWGRAGLDGKPRALHVNQSLESLDANTAGTPHLLRSDRPAEVLAKCEEFTIRRVRLAAGSRLDFGASEQPRILSVTGGLLEAETPTHQTFRLGDNVLLPFAGAYSFVAKSAAVVLVTEDFCRP